MAGNRNKWLALVTLTGALSTTPKAIRGDMANV